MVCNKNHVNPFVTSKKEVIYKVSFSCGKIYVGQTARCLNYRLHEHRAALSATPSGHLAIHCARCECAREFHCTVVMGFYQAKVIRQIVNELTRSSRRWLASNSWKASTWYSRSTIIERSGDSQASIRPSSTYRKARCQRRRMLNPQLWQQYRQPDIVPAATHGNGIPRLRRLEILTFSA